MSDGTRRAVAPWHGIRIVSRAGVAYAEASCRHGYRDAYGVEQVQALAAAYTEHRRTCAETPVKAPERPAQPPKRRPRTSGRSELAQAFWEAAEVRAAQRMAA